MADTVRHVMEEMVPELEDLESRGYFTKAELRSVTKKRTDFEYKMKRRSPKLSDYLKYAEYEMALEDLRRVRHRLMGTAAKRSLADYCITRRVHFIFERATRKFRGDLGLWSRWLDFCTHARSSRMTSRVLAKALRLHPTVPGLWGRSAAWEFDHKRDASSARKLLQRGLRMCPKSETLWVEYFRFELLYAAQLRARRAVLGIHEAEAGADDGDAEEEGGEEEEAAGALGGDAGAVEALLRGGIAAAVMNKARAAFPGSLSLQRRMLKVLDEFEFEGKEAMEESLLKAVREACSGDAESWDLLARRAADRARKDGTKDAGDAGADVFEEAVSEFPTAAAFAAYAAFVHEQMEEASAAAESGEIDSQEAERRAGELAGHLLSIYRRGYEAGAATRDSVLSWIALARRCGLHPDVVEAASAAESLEGGCGPALWGEKLAMAACADAFADFGQKASLKELTRRAVQDCRATEDGAAAMWLRALEVLSAKGDARALATLLGELEMQLSAMAKVMTVLGGLPAARKLYKRLLALPPAGGSLFHHLLDLEIAAAATDEDRGRVKRLFAAAAEHYGEVDTELWLRFVMWEQGGSGRGTAYWRAVKTLADPTEFTAAHQQSLLE